MGVAAPLGCEAWNALETDCLMVDGCNGEEQILFCSSSECSFLRS